MVLLVSDFTVKLTPQCSAKGLSRLSRAPNKKADVLYGEKDLYLINLIQELIIVLLSMSSMLINNIY